MKYINFLSWLVSGEAINRTPYDAGSLNDFQLTSKIESMNGNMQWNNISVYIDNDHLWMESPYQNHLVTEYHTDDHHRVFLRFIAPSYVHALISKKGIIDVKNGLPEMSPKISKDVKFFWYPQEAKFIFLGENAKPVPKKMIQGNVHMNILEGVHLMTYYSVRNIFSHVIDNFLFFEDAVKMAFSFGQDCKIQRMAFGQDFSHHDADFFSKDIFMLTPGTKSVLIDSLSGAEYQTVVHYAKNHNLTLETMTANEDVYKKVFSVIEFYKNTQSLLNKIRLLTPEFVCHEQTRTVFCRTGNNILYHDIMLVHGMKTWNHEMLKDSIDEDIYQYILTTLPIREDGAIAFEIPNNISNEKFFRFFTLETGKVLFPL